MIRNFSFCSNCADNRIPNTLWETSADFPYCATGHFYKESQSSMDGRPHTIIISVNTERDKAQDINSSNPSQSSNGGDYYFTAYKTSLEE